MKFSNSNLYAKKRDIYKPGFLTQLADDVISGKPAKEIKRLTTDEMHRLPEIYAQIDYAPETNSDITNIIESDKEYKTGNGSPILGSDIKAITMLMYLKPRTSYWKPDKAQIHDTSMCGAVPIPMLGFKTWRGIPYGHWFKTLWDSSEGWIIASHNEETLKPKFEISDGGGCILESMFKLDLLLGNTLASTHYSELTDEIEWSKAWGLGVLSCFNGKHYRPDLRDVRYFREYGMGKHSGSYASAYGTAKLDLDMGWTENEPRLTRAYMYNNCSTPMRLLLAQRWAWYGNHRNDNMICDFQDWDNIPKNVDQVSTAMSGLEPAPSTSKLRTRFNLG